ncbi:hypothetical protein [Streptomyces caelestis]|jgi:hypothetical protein|uniref:Uncharacterized protein n=1 Tax=Streptomyces caelestis TaxID=36816 RepID=A0A7W9H9F3_9ACTN|nr:hypothetical protein [Streptomyces caelestis]MBB5798137.1 hypothetical protein [Streptomyces caelestis]GGW65685.1 hypothetical protein GCM10010320_53730 [Streptomyces caelestis]
MLRLHVGGQRPRGELRHPATELAASAAAELRARWRPRSGGRADTGKGPEQVGPC